MVGVASLLPLERGEIETPTPASGPCKYLQFSGHSSKALLVICVPLLLTGEGQDPVTCSGHQELPAISHPVSLHPPQAAQAD